MRMPLQAKRGGKIVMERDYLPHAHAEAIVCMAASMNIIVEDMDWRGVGMST